MDINLKTKWINEPARLEFGGYAEDDSLAISAFSMRGEPLATCTVCLAEYGDTPMPGYVFIKDYSENEGMLQCLIQEKVIEHPMRLFTRGPYGVTFYECKLTPAGIAGAYADGWKGPDAKQADYPAGDEAFQQKMRDILFGGNDDPHTG